MTTKTLVFTGMEDHSLLDAAKQLASEERQATAALLRVLMEIDSRRLYLGQGYASMFTYCTGVLRLAEGAAYNRIEAARAARNYPLILELFERSAITLTAVRLLAPHLTADNHAAVLASATHKSKREVEELVAALRPKPDAPIVVRRLPAPRSASPSPIIATPGGPPAALAPVVSPSLAPVNSQREVSMTPPAAPHRAEPLAADRFRIQLTVSRETHDKFRRAQTLLRHAVPSGDAAEIFDRALTLLVERLEHQRFAATSRPRPSHPGTARSRYIPAGVRRAVWRRDGGRCAFVGADGRCGEKAFLEFHHAQPYAAGGPATVENIQLRCRAHNVYEARLYFGDDLVREAGARWG